MRRGHKGVFKAAIAALEFDLVRHEADAARTRDLITALMARAEVGGTGGTTGNAAALPPKRRRRRRHKSRPAVVRKAKRGIAAKRGTVGHVAIPVAAPVAAPAAAKPAPAKVVRGAALFKDQYQELERLGLGIAESGDNAEVANKLRVRADAVGRSMGGRGTYPPFFNKAERMRCRRLADAAPKVAEQPETKAPKKRKAPRKPTPAPIPPVKHDSGWRTENGVLSREIETR